MADKVINPRTGRYIKTTSRTFTKLYPTGKIILDTQSENPDLRSNAEWYYQALLDPERYGYKSVRGVRMSRTYDLNHTNKRLIDNPDRYDKNPHHFDILGADAGARIRKGKKRQELLAVPFESDLRDVGVQIYRPSNVTGRKVRRKVKNDTYERAMRRLAEKAYRDKVNELGDLGVVPLTEPRSTDLPAYVTTSQDTRIPTEADLEGLPRLLEHKKKRMSKEKVDQIKAKLAKQYFPPRLQTVKDKLNYLREVDMPLLADFKAPPYVPFKNKKNYYYEILNKRREQFEKKK